MLENEEPWMPPKPQQQSNILRISSQVPEVTIIDGESSAAMKKTKTNFIQRAISIEKAQVKNPAVTSHLPRFPPSAPQVPDLTILDEQVKARNSPVSRKQDRVFSESYKQMLINNHDQFKKQFESEKPATSNNEKEKPKRYGILTTKHSTDYKPNPLCKYVPSKIINDNNSNNNLSEKDGNSSSILIDVDKLPSPQKHQHQTVNSGSGSSEEKDDMTFRKVANMLSEIQKLVVSPRVSTNSLGNDITTQQVTSSTTSDILKELALQYLTPEEFSFYDIESEFE